MLTPELDVDHLDRSLDFYVRVIGFRVVFERPEERFAYLNLDGASLMLEETAGPGRRLRIAPLEHPYGRGMNLELGVANSDAIYRRVLAEGLEPLIPLEERWYRQGDAEVGVRQFVVVDPDGYLLRVSTGIGKRSAST